MQQVKKRLFFKFIEENIDNAYRFAYGYTKNEQDAEDVVNESAIKALKALRFLKNEEYMKTWFYRIIINTANTMFKKKSRLQLVDSNDISYQDSLLPEHYDDYSEVHFFDMIEQLSAEKRLVIILRYYEDYTISQIADILDANENTIKKRLYSSLKLLKKNLEVEKNEGL